MNTLFATDTGSGPVTVLLHGFCESSAIWDHFVPALQNTGRIICIDLPGFGQSPVLGIAYSIEAMAKSVMQKLTELKVDRFAAVGHSLGGYVALALAEMYPDRLTGLGLFHSSALADSDEKKESRDKTAAYVLEHGTEKFLRPFAPNLFFHARREELNADIQKVIAMGLHLQPEVVAGVTLAMRNRPDRTAVLATFSRPVMMIFGKNDSAVTLEAALAQCSLPAVSKVLFLNKTGHMGMYERPEETLIFLKDFVKGL